MCFLTRLPWLEHKNSNIFRPPYQNLTKYDLKCSKFSPLWDQSNKESKEIQIPKITFQILLIYLVFSHKASVTWTQKRQYLRTPLSKFDKIWPKCSKFSLLWNQSNKKSKEIQILKITFQIFLFHLVFSHKASMTWTQKKQYLRTPLSEFDKMWPKMFEI